MDSKKNVSVYIDALQKLEFNNDFEKTIELIFNCKGKIITSGMGKAGIAMKKFASSLSSLGVPAIFLHPGEASHGDLGMVQPNDILFVASTSGKTREIIELIDLYKNIYSNPIIGLTSHKDSLIREKAHLVLDMGEFNEIGKLNLAPTVSIVVMLVITDIIAVSVSEKKEFNNEMFSKYHHSGYLGELSRGISYSI